MMKELRPVAVPVIAVGSLTYLAAANGQFKEPPHVTQEEHVPAGALTNLATGTGTVVVPGSGVFALSFNDPSYQHVPDTVSEGEFKIPAANERVILGHHDVQVALDEGWNNLRVPPFDPGGIA
jgi:hypothetical protein